MAISLLGAFASPLDSATAVAARLASAAEAGGFSMPPMIQTVLNAVSVNTDPAQATANRVAAPSPVANVAPGDQAGATGAPTGIKAWLSGWRLAVVVAGGVAVLWYLVGRRRG